MQSDTPIVPKIYILRKLSKALMLFSTKWVAPEHFTIRQSIFQVIENRSQVCCSWLHINERLFI